MGARHTIKWISMTSATALLCAGVGGTAMLAVTSSAEALASTSAPVQEGGPLTWAPPTLAAPTVINVLDDTTVVKLSTAQDYLLKLPTTRAAVLPQGLTILGGHNVVVIGGTVDVRGGYDSGGQNVRRGMYLKGQTGTTYVEGVQLLSSTVGSLTEGIDLDESLGAQVVLQNDRVDRLEGSYATNHADGVQTWAGPRKLLIDGLSIDTDYQGMFLLPNQHFTGPAPELFDFRNISITGESNSAYMIWKDTQNFPWHLTNVDVKPGTHPLTARDQFLWGKGDPVLAPVDATNQLPDVAATAGYAYVSPGYASGSLGVSVAPSTPAPVSTPAPSSTATSPTQVGTTTGLGSQVGSPVSSPTPTSAPTSASSVSTLYRVHAGGSALSGSPAWSADTAQAPSVFTNIGPSYSRIGAVTSKISLSNPSVPAGTPMSLFQTQRFDVSKGADMVWNFRVPNGTYKVRMYFAETFNGAWHTGGRVFNVYANGKLALNHEDVYAEAGKNAGLVKTVSVTVTNGAVSLDFKPIVQNPMVSGIEILRAS